MILISVDLPAPLSPSRPTISSTPTVRLTSCSARTWSNDFETCSSSRRFVVAVSMDLRAPALVGVSQRAAAQPPAPPLCSRIRVGPPLPDQPLDEGDQRRDV